MSAIERYKDEIAALKARASAARRSAKEASSEVMDTAVTGVAGFALGAWEKQRRASNQTLQIAGMDADLVIAVAGIVGGEVLDGDAARLARSVGRGVAAVAGYKRGLA